MAMLFLSLLVLGIVAWRNIPLQLFPEGLDPPFIFVWLSYPNVTPADNQDRIAVPVEEALWTVKWVKRIRTRITSSGCSHFVEFQQNADMDVAYLNVRDRLQRVRPELPEELRYIYLWRYSEEEQPILYCGVSITGNYDDPYRLVEEEIVRRLERVDGVAKVELSGGHPKIVRIEFILDRLKGYNVNLGALMRDLREADFAVAGGTIQDSDRQLLVRVDGRIRDLDELADMPLRGSDLRLKDVALVSYSEPTQSWTQRIGRREAIEIAVYKNAEANAVELSKELGRVIEEARANPLLMGIQIDILFDQGRYILQSLHNLEEAGLWGALFAVMVLFFFLRRVRMTLFITLAIPLSIIATMTVLYFIGWSLNIITLAALMICIGLVVDNAIVVVENIHTARQGGLPAGRAAVVGASEVALAITMATLTTAVVFVPLMLMSGDRMMTFFMLRIGLPVIFALLASLMVALLFIPLVVNRLALSGHSRESKLIEKGAQFVERGVRWTLSHRGDCTLLLLLILASIALPMRKVISTDVEQGHINDVMVRFNFPNYYTLTDADSVITRFENKLYEHAEEYSLKTVVTGFRRGFGRVQMFMNEASGGLWFTQGLHRMAKGLGLVKSGRMDRPEILKDLKERYKPPPDVDMMASWTRGREEDAVYLSIIGEDTDRLIGISDDVRRRLEALPGVLSVEVDLEPTSDEVRIRFARDETARLGVDPLMSAFGLTAILRGVDLPEMRMGDREIDGRAELREDDRRTLSQVMNLPVTGWRGEVVRLSDVAGVRYERGIGEITREDRRTRIRMKINSSEEDVHKLSQAIDAGLNGLALPPGYEWGKGSRFSDVIEASRERSYAWLLAIIFVFLLMGALFESYVLPWCVIVTVPFSFFGVWWLMFLTGTQFGVMAGVGVIILIGVVVNNAIVLVDRVNRLRGRGMPRDEALATASRQRFRPIVMTALTTVMGLLPMAMGDASLIGLPYAPMGRAIIGGLLTATVTTPLVVPLAYSYMDDLNRWLRGYFTSFTR